MILQVLVRGQLLQLVVFGAVLSSICRAQSPTTSAASEALIVSPPLGLSSTDFSLAVGDESLITWTGGVLPFSVRVIGGEEAVNVASGQQFGLYSWVVSVPPGSGYQIEVEDATGVVATSEAFAVIAASATGKVSGPSGYASPTSTLDLPGYESYLQPRKSSTARSTSAEMSSTSAKTSSASSPATTSPSVIPASGGSLATSTKIGTAMGGVDVGLFLAALAGILLSRRRKSRTGGNHDSSLRAAGEVDPSLAVDPFPFNPDRPMTGTADSLASAAQPIHPGLLQQYSSGFNIAYLHPSPQSGGHQPGYFAGPPPMSSPTPSASAQTDFLPSSSSGLGNVTSSVGTSETAQDRHEVKTRLLQTTTPAHQLPLVIQETDSGAVDDVAVESERLPPSYNQAWVGRA